MGRQAPAAATQVALHGGGQVCGVVCDGLAVKGGHAVELDAQGLLVVVVAQLADLVGGGQQGLGGHAAAVDAGAANVVALNHSHAQALLGGGAGRGRQGQGQARGRVLERQKGVAYSSKVTAHQPEWRRQKGAAAAAAEASHCGRRGSQLTHSTACMAAPWPPTPQPMMMRS